MAEALGLRPADASTQVVLRDWISEWVSALAIIATVCEAIALEVRHGQRTEVRELSEAFGSGQKGSSAMPHKKNPIRSERIAGLARVVRAAIVPIMEGIPLWHERDISHSSTERVFLPDAAITTDYLLDLTAGLVENLVVDADRMRANLESTGGLIYTSSVLLELVEGGLSREDAYALVQAAAMETWNSGAPFRETLRARAAAVGVTLDEARLDEICRPEQYVANLGPLFDRLAALTVSLDLPLVAARQGARDLRRRVRPAAAGGLGPDLGLRPRAADADPRQGEGAHPAVGVVVRAADAGARRRSGRRTT